jgi:hypothetical protein
MAGKTVEKKWTCWDGRNGFNYLPVGYPITIDSVEMARRD